MVGFMAGVSVQIALGQLTALAGFKSAYANKVMSAADLFAHLGRADLPTALVGRGTVALVVVVMRTRIRLVAMAMALVVFTAIVALLDLPSVRVVGDIAPIPSSFPLPYLPDLSLAPQLILAAVSLVALGWQFARDAGRVDGNLDGALRGRRVDQPEVGPADHRLGRSDLGHRARRRRGDRRASSVPRG